MQQRRLPANDLGRAVVVLEMSNLLPCLMLCHPKPVRSVQGPLVAGTT